MIRNVDLQLLLGRSGSWVLEGGCFDDKGRGLLDGDVSLTTKAVFVSEAVLI